MYIKKKDRELFKKLDDTFTTPKFWKKFVKEQDRKNRLIIKQSKGKYLCTNCNIIFEDNIRINEYCKCPNCENIYQVKTNKLKHYEFKNELAILERYEDYYVVRVFRMNTYYIKGKYDNCVFEYGRIIYDNKLNPIDEIINDNVVGTIGGWFVSYRTNKNYNWRYFRTYYYCLEGKFIYYPYNLEEILSKNKKLKYSMLWELVKHVYCNLIYLINNYNPSIEILTKMKLYNLALCPEEFKNKKNFNERFMGLTKDYIPFIQQYNLDIDELEILSKLKIKNYNFIKRLKNLSSENLEYLNGKVNLITLLNKTNFDSSDFFEYRDYLNMAKKLKLNLKDKSILYPQNIVKAHNKVKKEYQESKDRTLNNSIKRRSKKLEKNIFKNNKYIIFPAKDYEALIDESSQQENCVRTYAERIANNECDIYFMRLIAHTEKSLVTVEVKDNKVVQKRIKNNGKTTKNQDKFLQLWENKILKKL